MSDLDTLAAKLKSLGAPGDYGYDTAAGGAIYLAHQILAEARTSPHISSTNEPRGNDIDKIAAEIADEVRRAEAKHRPMAGPHEGWAVIAEELDELWEHVRADTGRSREARREAIQIAAMGLRYALNLCEDLK